MSVARLDNAWNRPVIECAESAPHPRSAARDAMASEDWSLRKRFFCLVFASLASWAIVLAPVYAVAQIV